MERTAIQVDAASMTPVIFDALFIDPNEIMKAKTRYFFRKDSFCVVDSDIEGLFEVVPIAP
ncbi:hypothetical protein IB024_01220 [Brucella sp. 6810]|uniref:hypothetical protein n=1 Tax=Brucella sp. 6810 TaxID=2769351 RepID=UPI00165AD19A|nr:hypothetical protein [Brucella sp. 6810]QNQ62411.1 hypothetical protein IB024_01220 [Brucella sp. 6810]